MKKRIGDYLRLGAVIILLAGCSAKYGFEQPVQGFDPQRYVGQWYEIARKENRFEEGLTHVTAQYMGQEDGSIGVLNCGFNTEDQEWEEALGTANFTQGRNVGQLEVSFFGPFYGAYTVVILDPEYQYSVVAGHNGDYLWILARTPTLPEAKIADLKRQIDELNLGASELVFIPQREGVCGQFMP